MSRSYKKFPNVSIYCGKSGKFGRRQANKKIRKLPINYKISNGGDFKKLYESCNICDYSFTQFKEWETKKWEEVESIIQHGGKHWITHDTFEKTMQDWEKFYLRK